jgi:hypothetical protein
MHEAAVEIVTSGHHSELASSNRMVNDLAALSQRLRLKPRVGGDGIVDDITLHMPDLFHGRLDVVDDASEKTAFVVALHCCGDSSTRGVPHNKDQADVEVVDGVLQASKNDVIGDVTGISDYKDVSETLIEHDLGRDSRVGAAQHTGEWMLLTLERYPARGTGVGVSRGPGCKSAVPGKESLQRSRSSAAKGFGTYAWQGRHAEASQGNPSPA